MLHSIFRLSVVLSLSAFAALIAQAQRPSRVEGQPLQGQITGQIRYAEGGQPAFDVLVSCDSYSGGLVGQEKTDRSGRFRFSGLTAAQYTVTVRVSGYREEQQTVELLTTSSAYLQFQLKADGSVPSRSNADPRLLDANVPPAAQKEFVKAETLLATEKKESIEEGIGHLEKAVGLYPKFMQALLKLGTAYMDLGQWDKAEQTLRKALEVNPKAANALFARGEIYLRQKKDEEAEKVLLQGLQIEDHSFQGHLTLGRIYWDMASKIKDEAQAKPYLEKSYDQVKQALDLNPNLAQAHLLKGNLLLRVRRAQDALTEFEEYLRLEPKGRFAEQTRAVVDKIKQALASQKN